jgi:hypothetical protein
MAAVAQEALENLRANVIQGAPMLRGISPAA